MSSKFVPIKNPSLRETPRSQLAPILPSPQTLSLVDWLEQNKRMSARNAEESDFQDRDSDLDLIESEIADADYENDDDSLGNDE